MTKEEYKTLLRELSEKETSLKKQIEQTEVDYINEFAIANKGDKVKIVATHWRGKTEEHIGYVCRTYINDGEVCHSYWKSKKDGSQSSHMLHVYGKITSIELLEQAKP